MSYQVAKRDGGNLCILLSERRLPERTTYVKVQLYDILEKANYRGSNITSGCKMLRENGTGMNKWSQDF